MKALVSSVHPLPQFVMKEKSNIRSLVTGFIGLVLNYLLVELAVRLERSSPLGHSIICPLGYSIILGHALILSV